MAAALHEATDCPHTDLGPQIAARKRFVAKRKCLLNEDHHGNSLWTASDSIHTSHHVGIERLYVLLQPAFQPVQPAKSRPLGVRSRDFKEFLGIRHIEVTSVTRGTKNRYSFDFAASDSGA
jgi:hypothetical protein